MKPSHFTAKRFMKKVLGMFLVVVMLASIGILPASKVQATGNYRNLNGVLLTSRRACYF